MNKTNRVEIQKIWEQLKLKSLDTLETVCEREEKMGKNFNRVYVYTRYVIEFIKKQNMSRNDVRSNPFYFVLKMFISRTLLFKRKQEKMLKKDFLIMHECLRKRKSLDCEKETWFNPNQIHIINRYRKLFNVWKGYFIN